MDAAYSNPISLLIFSSQIESLTRLHLLRVIIVFRPKLNEPLYEPSKVTDGCTSAGNRCGKIIKGSECILGSDPADSALEGLCRTSLKEIPSEFSNAVVAKVLG